MDYDRGIFSDLDSIGNFLNEFEEFVDISERRDFGVGVFLIRFNR